MSWIELPKVTGSGGSGTPGGSSGDVQFNTGSAFGGDAQFQWDAINKILLLNGLAIRALSATYSLVDNNPTPTTITSWPSTYQHTIIEYGLDRSADTQTGTLYIANTSATAKLTDQQINTSEITDLGITFSVVISGSDVLLQYITTSTGFNGSFKIAARQW